MRNPVFTSMTSLQAIRTRIQGFGTIEQALFPLIGLVALFHGAAWIVFLYAPHHPVLPVAWSTVVSGGIILSFCLSIVAWLMRTEAVQIATIVARIGIILLIGRPFGEEVATELLLISSLVIDIGLILRPITAIFLIIAVISILALSQGEMLAWDGTIPAMEGYALVLLVSVPAAFGYCSLFVRRTIRHLALKQDELSTIARGSIEMYKANLELQQASTEVERRAMQAERWRISRELHDIVGYAFINERMQLEVALSLLYKSPDIEELANLLMRLRRQATQTLDEARKAIHALRTPSEEASDALERIRTLVDAFESTTIDVTANFGNVVRVSFGREIDSVLYRFTQEGITNAIRHGGAKKIDILMWEYKDEVIISVRDNGVGNSGDGMGLGLTGLEERVQQLGGALTTESLPYGFQLSARLPLTAAE